MDYYSAYFLADYCGGDIGVLDAALVNRVIVRYRTGLVFITGLVQLCSLI